MATITLRSAKGSPLTNNEVDANFTNLNTAKYEANDNISVGTIAGSTLTLTGNATFQGTTTLSASAAVSGAGSTQGAATALTASYNIVTSAKIFTENESSFSSNIKISFSTKTIEIYFENNDQKVLLSGQGEISNWKIIVKDWWLH